MDQASFRPATAADAADLAVLFDIASRRLMSWYWGQSAQPGQTALEVGRQEIRDDIASDAHYRHWHVLTLGAETAGGLCGLKHDTPDDPADYSGPARPFMELEVAARGTFYLLVAAVFAEHRGKGYGTILLDKAAALARASGATQLTLVVETFNPGAHRLYLRHGFRNGERRPFISFPGSGEAGELILMVKDLI